MSHSLSVCVSELPAREVADSPTKSSVRFRTEGVLFQLPTIPIKKQISKKRANFVRVLIVLLIGT